MSKCKNYNGQCKCDHNDDTMTSTPVEKVADYSFNSSLLSAYDPTIVKASEFLKNNGNVVHNGHVCHMGVPDSGAYIPANFIFNGGSKLGFMVNTITDGPVYARPSDSGDETLCLGAIDVPTMIGSIEKPYGIYLPFECGLDDLREGLIEYCYRNPYLVNKMIEAEATGQLDYDHYDSTNSAAVPSAKESPFVEDNDQPTTLVYQFNWNRDY